MSRNEAVVTETYKGHTIEIFQEEDISCCDPRGNDNLGTMACFHSRYNIGDKHKMTTSMFGSWEEMKNYIVKTLKAVVVLPIYMYDHSGQTIATTPFSCRWDSGQIGFIFVTRETAMKEYSAKRITAELKKKIERILEAEVKEYDTWMRGEVYYYNIDNDETGDCVGNCGGYITENTDELLAECKATVDYIEANKPQVSLLDLIETNVENNLTFES